MIELEASRSAPSIPVHFTLPTRAAIAAGEMKPTGADLRVTSDDAATVIPHWIEGPVGGDATDIWARIDVAAGRTRLFAYYGGEDAPATSNLRATFVEGVIANADFQSGTAPWFSLPPTGGGIPAFRLGADGAEMTLEREASSTSESAAAWCQRVTVPAGEWTILFDERTLSLDEAEPRIWIGGLEGRIAWRGNAAYGLGRSFETSAFGGGETVLCLGGALHPSTRRQILRVVYLNLRLRPATQGEIIPREIGPKESGCR